MKLQVKKGSTSLRLMVFIADSSSTTGAGKTGLAYNSPGIKWYYWRGDTGNAGGVSVTLATATRGTFTSGGFIEIDSTNLPGWYEIGVPNAAIASGSDSVVMMLHGVTNMAPLPIEIQLVSYDPNDAAALGLANLDAAISTRLASASISLSSGKVTVGTNDDKTGYALSVDGIAAIWGALTSGFVTAGSIGKRIVDYLTGDIFARIGSNGSGLTSIGDTRIANLDATVSSRLASASYSSPPSASTIASQVRTELGTELGRIDAAISSRAVAGDAMTLTTGERTAIANEVEAQIINEADAEQVLTAITDKIASVNPSLGGLTLSAIASQVRTELATELARIDVAISTRLATSGYTAPPSAATVATQVRTELTTELGRIDVALSTLATASALSTVGTNVETVSTNVSTLLGDWNDGGRLDLILDSRASQTSVNNVPSNVWNFNDEIGGMSIGGRLEGAVGNIETVYMDWAEGGRLDNILDARASQTSVTAVKATTDKIDTALVLDGSVYQFTANSLELAPAGGGGGSAPTAAEIAEEIFSTANGINTGESFRQWARRVRSVLYGKTSGMRTGTEIFKAADGTTALVTVTVDRKGNRSGVTLG